MTDEGEQVDENELRGLLIRTINRNSSTLDATPIDEPGVIAIEHETGAMFFVKITEA